MSKTSTDVVELVESDATWPLRYEQEAKRLLDVLERRDVLTIEHIGSTAIPGLVAKPIIDILIAVPDVHAATERFVSALRQLDYVFWRDNPKKDRLFFVKGMPPYGKQRTHHVHVVEKPSEMWDRLKFRDYLRAHEGERAAYAAIKINAAAQYSEDREKYTEAKSDFVARIMQLAKGTEFT